MNKHLRDCHTICAEAGLTVEGVRMRGKHLVFLCEEGLLSLACTPGDRRWRKNARAEARRLASGRR